MVDGVAAKNGNITTSDLTKVVHDDDPGGEADNFLCRINLWS